MPPRSTRPRRGSTGAAPPLEVDRQIRGLSPFPGAWVQVGHERVKLLRSRLAAGQGVPGQVLGGFAVACGIGAVEVLEAQREGKRPMPAAEVLKGDIRRRGPRN
jgi:methionyl-tRNA formyltransferase